MTPDSNELLQLTQRLLDAVTQRDWATYESLCSADLTCFEPEACGQLVSGLPFHRYYFQLGGGSAPVQVTLCQPTVHLWGDVGVVAYVRLQQKIAGDGLPRTVAFAETRVWHRSNGRWQHVHFHRSEIEASS
ncbi:MAG TPA: DUF4440 domain-containing protein [Gemmatales bacterium]|nr:DUF4440 domain-containing protein [Gemmatales bacterium]HMP58960.1 DUF4440 domain-containing protein [Gemmatales bacterium]